MIKRVRPKRKPKIERVRLIKSAPSKGKTAAGKERERAEKTTRAFSDLGIKAMLFQKKGQKLYWDKSQPGLSLLVGHRTKTFRATFKLNGKWISAEIGRFGDKVLNVNPKKENIQIAKARDTTANYRALAKEGIDPRKPRQEEQAASKQTFEHIVDRFINEYAKPRQRTWQQTERVLKRTCADWLHRSMNGITKKDASELLDGFIAAGNGYKAAKTRAWLKKLWRWAYAKDIVASPIMEGVEVEYERRSRDRVYSDAEIKKLWEVAGGPIDPKTGKKVKGALDPAEEAFVKLMILLVPRKSALAGMRWSEITTKKIRVRDAEGKEIEQELEIWTTPPERVKQTKRAEQQQKTRRTYETPLPLLAQRILKRLRKLKTDSEQKLEPDSELVFVTKKAVRVRPSTALMHRLAKLGAPDVFKAHADYHAWRHTGATWLQNQGYTVEECALVLNHKDSGVTAGYLHGSAVTLTHKMLTKWADHIEQLMQPKGVALIG